MRREMSRRRQRFFLMVSVAYILIGAVIVVRSLLGGVMPLVLLGGVFIALGLVRLRDYRRAPAPRP
ncbi:MAG: hypothetical protein ACRDFS_09815 [Chloroflexota bacterium]